MRRVLMAILLGGAGLAASVFAGWSSPVSLARLIPAGLAVPAGAGDLVSPAGVLAAAPAAGPAALRAPDFAGGGPWLNTQGRVLKLADLRGRVIAVEMWTGGCINCINTLPYVKRWDARYRSKGLTVVGVHSPEFQHEHSEAYVRQAIAREGITYPVVMDNDFRIWNAYKNEYWPTLYLIDKQGAIRYTHIGEGEYEVTERTIVALLAEPN